MTTYAGTAANGSVATVINFPHAGEPPSLPGIVWREVPADFSRHGMRWDGGAFVVDTDAMAADEMARLRARRNALLAASDWTQVADNPLTAEQRAAWAAYRQTLRDITDQPEAPAFVVWPPQP